MANALEALPDAVAGSLLGGGGALLYALTYQNRPTRSGYARLGRPNPSARYGWERSFHIDYHPQYGTHFNAEFGPLERYNHQSLPNWMQHVGENRVLMNIGRGVTAVGLAMDAISILIAHPCDKPRAIGGAVGGAIGAAAGAAIGSAIAPGIGTVIGGFVGGAIGGFLGDLIGNQFKPEDCECP